MSYTDRSDAAVRDLRRRLVPVATRIATMARDEVVAVIDEATPTGREYSDPRTGERYRASAPGEPPASHTGVYPESWQVEEGRIRGDRVVASAYTDLQVGGRNLGRVLEFGEAGPPAVAPRPHVRPALARLARRLRRALRGGRR